MIELVLVYSVGTHTSDFKWLALMLGSSGSYAAEQEGVGSVGNEVLLTLLAHHIQAKNGVKRAANWLGWLRAGLARLGFAYPNKESTS